jgi:hypothetical protein
LERTIRRTPVNNKVWAAYRRGDMLAKRHRLMADWQSFCDGR